MSAAKGGVVQQHKGRNKKGHGNKGKVNQWQSPTKPREARGIEIIMRIIS
jgi:hypothetical protein